MMRPLVRAVVGGSEIAAALLIGGAFAIMLAQVFFRYVLNSSLLWSEEAATWALVWSVMMGSVPLASTWSHVAVPVAVQALPLPLRVPTLIMARFLSLLFLAVLLWYGIKVFGQTFHRTAPMLGLSTRWMKLAFPVGAGLMIVAVLGVIADDVQAWRRGDNARFVSFGNALRD